MRMLSDGTDPDRWVAVCPTCRRELGSPGDTRGWCSVHGSVLIDFGHPLMDDGGPIVTAEDLETFKAMARDRDTVRGLPEQEEE